MRTFIFCISVILILFENCEQSSGLEHDASGKFTQEELEKLKLFREGIKDDLEAVKADFMKTDDYLMRWLRVKNLDVTAAKNALKEAITWRRKNKVVNILNENTPIEFIRNPFYVFEGYDKEGRPIVIADVKNLDTRRWVVGGQSKKYQRALVQMMEQMEVKIHQLANSSLTEEGQGQAVIIVDLQNYNLRQHACLACIPAHIEATTTFDRYYPLLFNKMFGINAPRIFAPLFALIKPVLSPRVSELISLFGQNKAEWQLELLKTIGADQLPSRLKISQ